MIIVTFMVMFIIYIGIYICDHGGSPQFDRELYVEPILLSIKKYGTVYT